MSQRLSIIDAAKALGISTETIRRRIRARQIQFEKDNTGKYWVICDPLPAGVTKPPTPPLPTHDQADLRNQIRLLEDQLKASHEAHAADRALLHETIRAGQAERQQLVQTIADLSAKLGPPKRRWWPFKS